MKLELTLAVPCQHVCDDEGNVLTHNMTGLGEGLDKLTWMWGMSATEVIERLVSEAVLKEEEENIVDGEYQHASWAKMPHPTYLH